MVHETNRVLLALQYWRKDREQAMRLARFLADIEPGHSEQADFLFSARFDCPHDPDGMMHVSRKFNTYAITSARREIGWPAGCNGLWFGTMDWFYRRRSDGKIPPYKAIITFEADCVPLSRTWIKELVAEWDEINAKSRVYMAGSLIPDSLAPGGVGHVNGNSIHSGDLKYLHWVANDAANRKLKAGWDWALTPDFMRWGRAGMRGINSVWRKDGGFSEDDWKNETAKGVVLFHGMKDDSLLELSRKKLLA